MEIRPGKGRGCRGSGRGTGGQGSLGGRALWRSRPHLDREREEGTRQMVPHRRECGPSFCCLFPQHWAQGAQEGTLHPSIAYVHTQEVPPSVSPPSLLLRDRARTGLGRTMLALSVKPSGQEKDVVPSVFGHPGHQTPVITPLILSPLLSLVLTPSRWQGVGGGSPCHISELNIPQQFAHVATLLVT